VEENSFYKRLAVVKIVAETDTAKTFVLQPLEGWEPAYKAGQFLTLVFQTRYGEKRRSYSISSSPDLQEPLSITVKKIDNGEFSRLLNYHTKVGDILVTSGISGFFLLPEKPETFDQYFFLAAGSGITPCYSLIKTLLATTGKKVVLIYSNKSEYSTIFYKHLQALQEKYGDRFSIRFLFSDIANVYQSRLSNWLLPQFMDAYLSSPQKALFYICGPFDYMQMAEITLRSRVAKENIFKENFTHWPRLILPVPPDTDQHTVEIAFNNNVYQLHVQFPVSILAEAKKNGISLPYSCEAGRCGSCIAQCTNGKVWMAYNEVLTDKEVAAGRVLICQGFPIGGDVQLSM
jgi:ferredoxin-NADP reductase